MAARLICNEDLDEVKRYGNDNRRCISGKSCLCKSAVPGCGLEIRGGITEEELLKAEGVLGFQEYIRKALKAGEDLTGLAEKLAQQDTDVILVSEEVGYGIVPADAFERQYREAVGRVCTALAAKSRRVTRVVCGIGTVLKDD